MSADTPSRVSPSAPAPSSPDEERIYPCDRCGTMRTKAEGGTVFTICDACWDIAHPKPQGFPIGAAALSGKLSRPAPSSETEPEDFEKLLDRLPDYLRHVRAAIRGYVSRLQSERLTAEEIEALIESVGNDKRNYYPAMLLMAMTKLRAALRSLEGDKND